jgi:hypothetical protein
MGRERKLFWLRRGKRPIRAVPETGAVTGDNAKMVCRARGQSVDIRTDILVCVPAVTLGWGCQSVTGRGAILKTNGRDQSVRINHSVERG